MVSEGMKERRIAKRGLQKLALHMRQEPTGAEARFWHHARNRAIGGMKFRRQVPVGRYIVDFLCLEEKLIVEIDGGQHGDEQDGARDSYLRACGYRVLRFWNSDVADMEAVVESILAERPPHPVLSPGGGEE